MLTKANALFKKFIAPKMANIKLSDNKKFTLRACCHDEEYGRVQAFIYRNGVLMRPELEKIINKIWIDKTKCLTLS